MSNAHVYLYLISQTTNSDYDTYDSAIVAAYNEEDAKLIHPQGFVWNSGGRKGWGDRWGSRTWADPNDVSVTLVGVAVGVDPNTVVLFSFNAG